MSRKALRRGDGLKTLGMLGLAVLVLLVIGACQQEEGLEEGQVGEVELNGETGQQATQVYRADLSGINTELTDQEVTGTATVEVRQDSVTMTLEAQGVAPGTMHLAHFHAFADGQESSCPSPDQADQNDDGIIDVNEATQQIGQPLVPFTNEPTQMDLQAKTYPVADSSGRLFYTQTVALSDLQNTLQQEQGITDLDFSNGVINIHGVTQNEQLPQSVQSLQGLPAYQTVPIACGKFELAPGGQLSRMNGEESSERRMNGTNDQHPSEGQGTPQPQSSGGR